MLVGNVKIVKTILVIVGLILVKIKQLLIYSVMHVLQIII